MGSGVGGVGCEVEKEQQGIKSPRGRFCNVLNFNELQKNNRRIFLYITDVLHEKGEKGIIFIYTIRYIDIIFIL